MSSEALTVIAALGASGLTAVASLGVVWFQEHLRRKRSERQELITAVTEMLSRSMGVSLRADAMGQTMKIRSGLGEGIDVLTHQRKPFDAQELHDWVAQDMGPLNAAWSAVWALGDQELIRRANALLAACSDLISVSTARTPAETAGAKLRRHMAGDRWTPEMLEDIQKARVCMADGREQLAQYARQMLGMAPAQLFGHEGEPALGGKPAPRDSPPGGEVALNGRMPDELHELPTGAGG